MNSDEIYQNNIYEGINGETFYIFITDTFKGTKHGDAIIYKASPIDWLRNFLNKYSPTFNYKYSHLDKGGELFNNPDVKDLLQ